MELKIIFFYVIIKLVSHYFYVGWRSEISTMEYRLLNICIHWRDINHEYAIQEKLLMFEFPYDLLRVLFFITLT